MEQLDQLQLVVAEVQAARQQVSSVRAQVQELEGTIAAVASQPEGMALHRQMGGVLIEVADREALMKELKEINDMKVFRKVTPEDNLEEYQRILYHCRKGIWRPSRTTIDYPTRTLWFAKLCCKISRTPRGKNQEIGLHSIQSRS